MASEAKRGCGYRKVGGLYLVGGGISVPCDRLPFRLESCPVCGAGVHFTRAMTEINPLKLFGTHDKLEIVTGSLAGEDLARIQRNCKDLYRPCQMCDPVEKPAYIMMVGEKFYPTPDDFRAEAGALGISKRIPFIPKNIVLGETPIYLAHNKACTVIESSSEVLGRLKLWDEANGDGQISEGPVKLLDAPKITKVLGIFQVFIPKRIEKIYWEKDLENMTEDEKRDLEKRHITPVGIPDGDPDHI